DGPRQPSLPEVFADLGLGPQFGLRPIRSPPGSSGSHVTSRPPPSSEARPMQYRILHDSSAADLELTVNTWIGLGWTPLGGASASVLDGEPWFAQAIPAPDQGPERSPFPGPNPTNVSPTAT